MDGKQIRYFLSVAEYGSFSTAADELYISQSSLSKQILALEKEIGLSLFDRSRRKIQLTGAGEVFLAYARRIHQEYLALQAELDEFKGQAVPLAIVAIPVIAQYGMTAWFAGFQNAFPDIQFTLEEQEASLILPALLNHQFDLAFVRNNTIDAALFETVEILSDRLALALSCQHRIAGQSVVSLTELANENFILLDKGTVVHELAVEACQIAGFQPRVFYASLRIDSILSMVGSNFGVALMMEKILEYYHQPEVVTIPLVETVASKIVLAYLKDRRLPRPARVFVEFIRQLSSGATE